MEHDEFVLRLRRIFEQATGLRTYAARKWTTGGLFDAEFFPDEDDSLVQEFIAEATKRGLHLIVRVRDTRMTIHEDESCQTKES